MRFDFDTMKSGFFFIYGFIAKEGFLFAITGFISGAYSYDW